MPFALVNHICYIRLSDDRAGEIIYELIGTTELPLTIETFPF